MSAAAGAALLVAVLALSATPAAAIWPFSSSRGAVPTAPEPAAGSSIPAPEVAQRAEEASKVLRDVEALLAPGAGIVAIQERLPDIDSRLTEQAEETERVLRDRPSGTRLDTLNNQWQSLRAEVATYVNVLAERATALERSQQRLSGLRETWSQARTDARASRAPAQVVDRIGGILAGIDQTRARLQQERAATLVLQDRVAQHVARCDDALVRLGAARVELAGRLLVQDGVPLWQTEELSRGLRELPDRVRAAVAGGLAEVDRHVDERQVRIYASLVLFAGLAALIHLARRAAPGPAPRPTLDRPLAGALLLTVLANGFSSPQSRAAYALAELLALLPALRIVSVTLDPARVQSLRWLGAVLVADMVRRSVAAVPLLEQQIFLLVALGVIGRLGWRLVRARRAGAVEIPGLSHPSLATAVALAAALVAAGAAAAGYMRLALFIGAGILGAVFVALVLYAGVKVLGDLLVVALGQRPLRGLRMVQRHRPLLERRATVTLRWLAIAGWTVLTLRHFGLWSATVAGAQAILAADAQWGSLSVSLGGVVVFVVTVVATFLLSALVRFAVQEELYPRLVPGRPLPYAVSTLVHYTVIIAGFLLGLAVLGVDLTKVTIVAGALGVGIGFGLQNLVNNFVSGLVILYERRINVGDAVQVGDVGGQVQQMGLRACTVRTWEGAEVIVPNATLTAGNVVNWTLSDRRRRIDLKVGVAYGTSPERLADVLLAVARKHAHVLAEPAPVVLFRGFGDSALLFEMRVWTGRFDEWVQIQSELTIAAYAALGEAGITIPFPQHDIHMRPA